MSIGFYVSLFLVLMFLYSLLWPLGLCATLAAVSYYAREELLKRIVEETTGD